VTGPQRKQWGTIEVDKLIWKSSWRRAIKVGKTTFRWKEEIPSWSTELDCMFLIAWPISTVETGNMLLWEIQLGKHNSIRLLKSFSTFRFTLTRISLQYDTQVWTVMGLSENSLLSLYKFRTWDHFFLGAGKSKPETVDCSQRFYMHAWYFASDQRHLLNLAHHKTSIFVAKT
jgi:hypothetical protein